MHVAYILNTYPLGSHSFIRREIQALERRGVTVSRFAMRPPPEPLVDPLNVAEHDRTEYVLPHGKAALGRALLRQMLRSPAISLAAARQALRMGTAANGARARHMIYLAEAAYLAARCRSEGVQHLHAHFGTNATTVAMLVHLLTGLPFSFTVHGPEEFDQPIALSLGDKIAASAFTVGISQFGRSQLCRWVDSAYWDRIKVVHCGIEPAAFAPPVPIPAMDQGLRLVSIGRFAEQKGQALLVQTIADLRDALPDLHLTLIGDGDLRAQIEALIARHDLGAQVTLTGWVDEARIRAELDAAHALVLPSFAEGLPMVIMEAMAAGRPVLSTYIAGIPELVQQGQSGWLVPAGDQAGFGAAITALAELPSSRLDDMGQTARARVFERHDIDREAEKLAGFFASVADRDLTR